VIQTITKLLRLMLVASGRAPSTFLNFVVFPLSRQRLSSLYGAEQAPSLFFTKVTNLSLLLSRGCHVGDLYYG